MGGKWAVTRMAKRSGWRFSWAGDARVEGKSGPEAGAAGAGRKAGLRLLAVLPRTLRARLLPVRERWRRQSEMLLGGLCDARGLVPPALAQRLAAHPFRDPQCLLPRGIEPSRRGVFRIRP